jgi:hypothetical protein
LIGARWHGGEDQEVVPGWHASAYLCMLIDEERVEFIPTLETVEFNPTLERVEFIPTLDQDYIACAVVTRGGSSLSRPLSTKPDAEDPESSEDLTWGHDIYSDVLVIEYLCSGTLARTIGAKERDQILQRAKRFKWEGSHMLTLWKDGRVRLVPQSSEN